MLRRPPPKSPRRRRHNPELAGMIEKWFAAGGRTAGSTHIEIYPEGARRDVLSGRIVLMLISSDPDGEEPDEVLDQLSMDSEAFLLALIGNLSRY